MLGAACDQVSQRGLDAAGDFSHKFVLAGDTEGVLVTDDEATAFVETSNHIVVACPEKMKRGVDIRTEVRGTRGVVEDLLARSWDEVVRVQMSMTIASIVVNIAVLADAANVLGAIRGAKSIIVGYGSVDHLRKVGDGHRSVGEGGISPHIR